MPRMYRAKDGENVEISRNAQRAAGVKYPRVAKSVGKAPEQYVEWEK